jgi:hypothetical protein
VQQLANKLIGGIVICVLGLISLGLLVAAAVVGFAHVVGVGGALGIVGGIVAVFAMAVMLTVRRRVRRIPIHRTTVRGTQLGSFAAGFALGIWDSVTRSRRRD